MRRNFAAIICTAHFASAWILLNACNAGAVAVIQDSDLAAYRGGYDQWCVQCIWDPAGVDCNECTYGNGQWFRCNATMADSKPDYVQGQVPANHYDFFDQACSGAGQYYSDACITATGIPVTCQRHFDNCSYLGISYDVTCP